MQLLRRVPFAPRIDLLALVTVLVVAVGFADGPFLGLRLPIGDDTEIHLYRLVDLDQLVRQGILYSRWQPDQVYGYGSPLFSFYAPLSAYLTEAAHLAGISFRSGMLLAFASLPIIAGCATFAFLRRRLATGPALLGAVAYLSSLYFLYDILIRGSISDALAMALFPVVLLALDRLMERPEPLGAAVLSLAIAALLLSHNVSGPVLLPLVVLCAGWWSAGRRMALGWGAVGITLGVGLALFFFGPAALGAADTRVPDWLAEPAFHFDQHFVQPRDLFVLAATATPGSILTNLPLGLGLVQSVVALAALPILPWLRRRERGEVVIFGICFLACVFLTLPASRSIWNSLPFLQVVSLPWRLLAIPDFAGALLIGYAAEIWLPRRGPAAGMAFGPAALVLLTLAIPYLYPIPGDRLPANPSLADVTAFQQRSGAIGTTSNSEFLPRGLREFPKGPAFLGADEGVTLDRKLDPASLPAGATVRVIGASQLATRLTVSSPAPFTAHFFVFRFPGWSATLDGRPAGFAAPGPYQTLTIAVPPGDHEVGLAFGETRTQSGFDLVSIGSALGVLSLLAAAARRSARSTHVRAEPLAQPNQSTDQSKGVVNARQSERSSAAVAGILAAAMIVLVLKVAVFDRIDTPLVHLFDGAHPPGMATVSTHRFGNTLVLLGYTLSAGGARPGGVIDVDLFWETAAAQPVDYSSFVHLLAADGQKVAQDDHGQPAEFPMSRWRVGAYARDRHTLKLPSDLLSGAYRIEIGIYDSANGRRLSVDGTPSVTDTLFLAPVSLADPSSHTSIQNLRVAIE